MSENAKSDELFGESGETNRQQTHDESEPQQPLNQGRNYARTLEGVLQMAIESTPAPEENATNEMGQMAIDPQRREFLENVFSEMFKNEAKDMIEHLKTLEQKLESEKEDDEELCENILEYLCDLCDGIDNAQDFHKVGGTRMLPKLMDHPRGQIRWRTFELIATLVQNVPKNQQVLLEMGGIEKLLATVDKDASETVRIKALYALSCLARDNQECQRVFVDNDGFSVLMRAMQSDIEKLQIKSAFMLQALFQEPTEFKDILHDMGMVHQLVGLLQSDHTPTHEHFMLALLNVVRDHKGCIQDCREPQLHFNEFLVARAHLLSGKAEFQEEYSYSQELLKICFGSNHGNRTSLDR